MRARVRTDAGEQSGLLDVTQGLRQGCVFFAAAMHVMLVRFSEHPAICTGFVSPRGGP